MIDGSTLLFQYHTKKADNHSKGYGKGVYSVRISFDKLIIMRSSARKFFSPAFKLLVTFFFLYYPCSLHRLNKMQVSVITDRAFVH